MPLRHAVVHGGCVLAVSGGEQTGPNPVDRGKHGSKLHLMVDRNGLPLAVRLSAANAHDATQLLPQVDAILPIIGPPGEAGAAAQAPVETPRRQGLRLVRPAASGPAAGRAPPDLWPDLLEVSPSASGMKCMGAQPVLPTCARDTPRPLGTARRWSSTASRSSGISTSARERRCPWSATRRLGPRCLHARPGAERCQWFFSAWKQATSYWLTEWGFFEFCGCSPA
jgi:hypothetical protein